MSSWKGFTTGAHGRWLGAILAAAFLLRVWGNLYDLGSGFHPDEEHYVHIAVRMMAEGTLNPAYFQNPPLYSYAILLVLAALFGGKYATGRVASRAEFVETLPPLVPFGIARGLVALAGTATCLVLYLLGRRYGGELTGTLAAGFYAVAFLSVRDAHFAVNDIPMVLLVTLAVLFAVRFLEGGRTRDLVWGGLAAELAVATKYNGGIALVPLLLACVLRTPEGSAQPASGRVAQIGRRSLLLLLVALAGFLLGNPYAFLDPPPCSPGSRASTG